MKQHSLRYLYKHLGKALKKLPFEITDHNIPVAMVIKKEDIDCDYDLKVDIKKIQKEDEKV